MALVRFVLWVLLGGLFAAALLVALWAALIAGAIWTVLRWLSPAPTLRQG
jgi:hypothetical protein